MIKNILLAGVSSLLFSSSWANSSNGSLNYLGKPIDPLCFTNTPFNEKSIIQLSECGVKHTELVPSGHNTKLIENGYIGTDYKDPGQNRSAGYSYYKILLRLPHERFVLHTIASGGGTGEFTQLLNIQKQANQIQLKTIASGDRCNGGIDKVSAINAHTIQYNVNLTAADFLSLSGQNPYHLEPYNDLDACAACCIATATYIHKIGNKPHIKEITLEPSSFTENGSPSSSIQSCFNHQLKSTFTSQKNSLNENELKQFMQRFNTNCAEVIKKSKR